MDCRQHALVTSAKSALKVASLLAKGATSGVNIYYLHFIKSQIVFLSPIKCSLIMVQNAITLLKLII